jgi:hypothetical protein
MMNRAYIDAVRLLLEVAPEIFREPAFALRQKGLSMTRERRFNPEKRYQLVTFFGLSIGASSQNSQCRGAHRAGTLKFLGCGQACWPSLSMTAG